MKIANVVSVSGGKDSTALLLLAKDKLGDNFTAVFADTGHEHQKTYEYVEYLSKYIFPIKTVKADFSKEIERKRHIVQTKWRNEGVSKDIIQDALNVLRPTGIPFLDLCLWKGRFPSTKARFCSEELKHHPVFYQVIEPLLKRNFQVICWQGIRSDESEARKNLPPIEDVGGGLWNYRPLLNWSAADIFCFHDHCQVKPNPLYSLGMGRVGCMPCIHARKAEIKEIHERFPSELSRVKKWEEIVSFGSKRQASSFFGPNKIPQSIDGLSHKDAQKILCIDSVVEWSKTTRGGKQYDLLSEMEEPQQCSSIYGLCE